MFATLPVTVLVVMTGAAEVDGAAGFGAADVLGAALGWDAVPEEPEEPEEPDVPDVPDVFDPEFVPELVPALDPEPDELDELGDGLGVELPPG